MIKSKKEYSNGVVTVVYESDLCIHSGVCSKGLPDVFQPGTRPWVKAKGAGTEEIIRQVQKCPSRALSFYMNSPDPEDGEKGPIKAIEAGHKVEVFKDGPIMMEGPITLVGSDGQRKVMANACYFCRCGASKSKPFCDGSHKEIGFKE
ncbi:(4Fe-4S)-binding protein [Labilibaculum sp.]|uniref:(4Fe-4S)-binding protein n=1 Tax=Labilibaculum sp. TaxID=2060723 RepID=UPI002AA93B15|nr:(4Fe-4S)-binding protein [Labilibaculum sp.]MBN2595620.1 (4Fe-4S)-binding protein [Marinifilaceae bacterium]